MKTLFPPSEKPEPLTGKKQEEETELLKTNYKMGIVSFLHCQNVQQLSLAMHLAKNIIKVAEKSFKDYRSPILNTSCVQYIIHRLSGILHRAQEREKPPLGSVPFPNSC